MANKKLFAGGPPANKNLFAGGPPANKKLFAGGPPANKKLYSGALSLLCSSEWSYAVLFSLSLFRMLFYSLVRSYKGLYCPFWFCLVVQLLGWSFLVVYVP